MKVETETIEISRVYLSDSEQTKMFDTAKMFSSISKQAQTKDLQKLATEINDKILDFVRNYCM